MKFGRTWKMVIQGNSQLWTFGYPFTIRMNITSTGTPTPMTANFFIYNLPENCRKDILLDMFYIGPNNQPLYRKINLVAGYSNATGSSANAAIVAPVFAGNVFFAYSYRQGPDWITEIQAKDGQGAIDIAQMETTLSAVPVGGLMLDQVYRTLCQALVAEGRDIHGYFISKSFSTIAEPLDRTLSGNPWDELIRDVIPRGVHMSIYQGTIYITLQNEYITNPSNLTEINPEYGMIGSPRRQQNYTIVTMLFEPRLQPYQKITLKSLTGSDETKLMNVRHYGEISESECGEMLTEAAFLRTPNLTQAVAA